MSSELQKEAMPAQLAGIFQVIHAMTACPMKNKRSESLNA